MAGDQTVQREVARAVQETEQNAEISRLAQLAQDAWDKADATEKQIIFWRGCLVVLSGLFVIAQIVIGWWLSTL